MFTASMIVAMNMTPVSSSAVDKVGYDAPRRLLRLMYTNGRVYDYFDVPPNIYDELLQAESVGEFVNLEIKPHYDYCEVE